MSRSISPALKASARAAYRHLFRAASATFSGDDRVLKAFRLKMRSDAIEACSITDPKVYEEKVQLAIDIARILRMNIVQAEKTRGQDTWKLRLTEDTELGVNESIKDPSRAITNGCPGQEESSRSLSDPVHNRSPARSAPPRFYSALKRAHDQRQIPELKEEDLEEVFVRGDPRTVVVGQFADERQTGSGPGGQSVNKTKNNVQLIHRPTGIRVTCHTTRSLTTNRMLARRLLQEKLDEIHNPGLTKADLRRALENERQRRQRKKAKKKLKKTNVESSELGSD